MRSQFLHPCFYIGGRDTKSVDVPGRADRVNFTKQDGYEWPVAFVTEPEGRALERRSPELFRFQPPSASETDASLQEQINELKARLEALEARGNDMAPTVRRGRPAKAEVAAN